MARMDELYSNLTGVDIEQQKRLWDDRGKGYYGEFLIFCRLYQNISGNCKILMNLEIPTHSGKRTEIDLLMIHETGLYVFEVKHFKGTIYGKTTDKSWTQYFRTAPNQSFNNPIKQNEYHINALKNSYPGIPIHSFVVFTNPECDLRVQCEEIDVNLCILPNLVRVFEDVKRNKKNVFDISQIDQIFCDLQAFSPLTKETVRTDSGVIPFYEYVASLYDNFQKEQKKSQKKTRDARSFSAAFCGLCVVLSFWVCSNYNDKCQDELAAAERKYEIFSAECVAEVVAVQQKLEEFARKFEYVEDYGNGEIIVSKDLVFVSDVVLKDSVDLENTVCFSCLLTWNGEDYSVSIGENAKLIVILKDGSVKEYDLWNERYPFNYTHLLGPSSLNKTGQIGLHEFYGLSVDDIDYIKLINLGIRDNVRYSNKDIAEGYEVELYRFIGS